jgi:hypothetical protein
MLNDRLVLTKDTRKDGTPPFEYLEYVDFSVVEVLDLDKSTCCRGFFSEVGY